MASEKSQSAPTTLSFHFTPVGAPDELAERLNPHIKQTTHVPDEVAALKEAFGDRVLEVTEFAGEFTILVESDAIVDVCRFLKENRGFDYLIDIGGIDRFTEDDRYEVFYNLVSLEKQKRIRLKTRVDEESMTLDSISEVYLAANWNERECYDMFGIRFTGHPDLRRMYMPEDFEYYPLRKEFPLLGIPGSLPLPPQTPEAGLTGDPYPAAHGSKPIKSFQEAPTKEER